MADLIIDYELDTNVSGTCESACTLVLLAGEKRTLERGSWVNFISLIGMPLHPGLF